MKPPATIPDLKLAFPEHAATVFVLDEDRFQVFCATCLRPSPILRGNIEEALICVDDLGWTTVRANAWTCPLCCSPTAGRYALP